MKSLVQEHSTEYIGACKKAQRPVSHDMDIQMNTVLDLLLSLLARQLVDSTILPHMRFRGALRGFGIAMPRLEDDWIDAIQEVLHLVLLQRELVLHQVVGPPAPG